MKVYFQKISSVVLALTIALSCMCVPSFAASGASSDVSSVLGRYYDYLDQYLNGEISYEAFQDKSNAAFHDVESDSDRSALENLLSGLTNAAEGISYASSNVTASFVKIYRDTVKGLDDYFDFWDNVGGTLFDSFEDLWNEYANKNDLTDSAVDMNGYDVALYVYLGSTGKLIYIYYGSVGEFYGFSDDSFKLYIKYDVWVQYLSDGSVVSHLTSSSLTTQYYYSHPQYEFYGSWKNRDGSDVPDDLISPNETTTKDIDDLPDDTDLTDFFNDLLDKLKDLFPDLSTIEGLLRAILAKLGTLDSDNDNELLEQILVAIEALKNNGETADNSELLKTLEELKNALVVDDGETVSSLAEMLNQLVQNQVRRSDITIDPSLYNQRYALIEAKLLGKFSFISEIKRFIEYAIDSYSNSADTPEITVSLFDRQHTIDFSAFDDSIVLIRWVIAAFVYLSYAFATFRKIPGYINGGDNQ